MADLVRWGFHGWDLGKRVASGDAFRGFAGVGADQTVGQTWDNLVPIQALIDAVKAGNATTDQANTAQAAVDYLQDDLSRLDPNTRLRPRPFSPLGVGLVGLTLGVLVTSVVFMNKRR